MLPLTMKDTALSVLSMLSINADNGKYIFFTLCF